MKRTSGNKLPRGKGQRRRGRCAAAIEPLDDRVMLSVTALFAGGTLTVTGDDQDNVIMVSRTVGGTILVNNGAIPIQGGPATIANTTHFHLAGAGGNDNISLDETNGPLPGAALSGGAGNDTLIGGSGIDFADGDAGNDLITLGAGNDDFQWNSGDGNDVVDGGEGRDLVTFNGADVAEKFDISDSLGGLPFHHVRLTRDMGSVSMDFTGLEVIDLNALGGADTVTVNNLAKTELGIVNVDLSSSGGTGDGQADAVVINGTNGDDAGQVFDHGSTITANLGLQPFVNITGAEVANDTLTMNGLGGADVIDASTLEAGAITLTLNGGDGNDVLTGSQGDELINGGAQTDTINVIGTAANGATTVLGSSGDDAVNVSVNGAVVFDATERIGALTIGSGGVATATAGGSKVLTVTSLSIAGTGKLNLNDNDLIVDYAPQSASPIGSIRSLLASGFHGGAWDGSGIMTSLGNASTFALGFAEASDLAAGLSFAGQVVDGTSVVVKFTHYGDATLDGKVDFKDLVKLAQNFNTTVSATNPGAWGHGDFNYDGAIDFNDVVKLAQNFNGGTAAALSLGAPVQGGAGVAAVGAAQPVTGPVVWRRVRVARRAR